MLTLVAATTSAYCAMVIGTQITYSKYETDRQIRLMPEFGKAMEPA
jgi:hypothetical protein